MAKHFSNILARIILACTTLTAVATAAEPSSQPAPGVLDLLVVGPDGKPLSPAYITVSSDGKALRTTTGPDGHISISLPTSATSFFRIQAQVPGLVNKRIDWNSRATEPIPANYILKMETGTRVSGHVIDDAGQPVVGAHVQLWISRETNANRERIAMNESLTTDKDGKWITTGVAPSGAVAHVGVWDYNHANGGSYDIQQLTPEQTQNGSFTTTLDHGVAVNCTVVTADGSPIPKARVATGGQMTSNRVPPNTVTKEGRVTYYAKPGEDVVLTATAAGYAPELTHFVMGAEKRDITITLTNSIPMIGRVVDPEGKAVPRAWIYLDTWRGYRSLEVRIQADQNGKFTWKDAPIDEVLCNVEAPNSGLIRASRVPLTASDQELVVTLKRAPHVQGTVVDADTAAPIESFHVIQGISFGKDQPTNWQRQQQLEVGHLGKFSFDLHYSYPGYAVRIEADGYNPVESRIFTGDEQNVVLDLKMTKGQPLVAMILTPDGKPAAGAKVLLLESGQSGQIRNGREWYAPESPQATASNDGRCTFPPEPNVFKLIALHDAGFAEVDSPTFPKSGEIHLIPWAQVQGKMMKGNQPWPNQKISAKMIEHTDPLRPDESRKTPHVFQQMQVTSDASGNFTIDRVPPGSISIGRYIEPGSGRMRWGTTVQTQQITLVAGEAQNITIGGQGQPVIGRIIIPKALADRHDWSWNFGTIVRSKVTTTQGFGLFLNRLAATQPIEPPTQQAYALEIGADGTFRIEDVLPGIYEMSPGMIAMPADNSMGYPNDQLATGHAEFTVPDLPGGRTDQAMELPDLPLTLVPHIQVGDAAPDFSATTTAGKDLKLTDFKGKFVLVEFFVDAGTPEVNEIHAIKSAAATFAGDDRFVILGININSTAEAKSFTEKNGLTWTAASITPDQSPMQTYGLSNLPSIWLIGADGKVIAKNLRGEEIKSALRTALGAKGL